MTNPMIAKVVRGMREKKYRENTKRFLVEGEKNVLELLESDFKIDFLCVTRDFRKKYEKLLTNQVLHTVESNELTSYGTLENNHSALAVVHQKPITKINFEPGLILVLDDIRDPGNLGTIIRIADWYGVRDIVCSINTVDWMNPKVINGSMGSFVRVQCHYTNLTDFLKNQKLPKFGAVLNGESIHKVSYPEEGILVIGSESHGISKDVAKYLTQKITIPAFGKAESLNAGIATAVILDKWRNSIS